MKSKHLPGYFHSSKALSIFLSALIVSSSLTVAGTVTGFAEESNTPSVTVDYGLKDNIQDGTILHCFDWKYNDIRAELPNIAQAGFSAIQTSPAQPGGGIDSNVWYWLYQPLGFYIGANDLGTKADLQNLCEEAEQYGIKVIVDVVSNHFAGDHTYIQNEFQNSVYWRVPQSSYADSRKKAIYKDIGMPDIVSENADVKQAVHDYIQELKSVGVDGIRWDTAKHIQLQSDDGCTFWNEVIDPEMYNYGEILGSPDGVNDTENTRLMQEYSAFMSITDDTYCKYVRDPFNNETVTTYSGYWTSKGMTADKLVYWGESHDTWSNNDGYGFTNRTSQNVIDRTYAIVAARAGATALYFSRPDYGYKENILAGVKGSTHFTSPEVAAVNHFHNAMASDKKEYYSKKGDNTVCAVCRTNGAVVVAGKGGNKELNVTNGGNTTTAGTYIDEITGNEWTVTVGATEGTFGRIIGTVGSSGIAVLFPKNTYKGSFSANFESGTTFNTNTLTVRLTTSGNVRNMTYTTSENQSGTFTNGTTITVGGNTAVGDTVTLTLMGTKTDNTPLSVQYTYKKIPADPPKVYFDNSSYNWSDVYVYAYYVDDNGNTVSNTAWPGVKMTETDENGYYVTTLDNQLIGKTKIIFYNNKTGTAKIQVPQNIGMDLSTMKMILHKVGNVEYVWDNFDIAPTATNGSVSADAPQSTFTEDTMDITLHCSDVVDTVYMTSEGDNGSFADGDTITIGTKTNETKDIKVAVRGTKTDGRIVSQVYTYTKEVTVVSPDDDIKVYFDNSAYNWQQVWAYVYIDDKHKIAGWPGTQMTDTIANGYYVMNVPAEYQENGRIIFNNGGNGTQYPANAGLTFSADSMLFSANYSWNAYTPKEVWTNVSDNTAFENSLAVTLYADGLSDTTYTTSEDNQAHSYTNGQTITIGETLNAGEDITLTLSGTKADSSTVTETYTYHKGIRIYFDNNNHNWSKVYAYVFNINDEKLNGAGWPGQLMQYNSSLNLYELYVTGKFVNDVNGQVRAIFTDSSTQYPQSGSSTKLYITGKPMILTSENNWVEFYTKVEAKAPTFTENGNIEYYNGFDGKYYQSDGKNYTEISEEDIVIPHLVPDWNAVTVNFTDGSNGIYAYTGNAITPEFTLMCNGEELPENYYTVDGATATECGKHTITLTDSNDENNTTSIDWYIYQLDMTVANDTTTENKIKFTATRNADAVNVEEFGIMFDRAGRYANALSMSNATSFAKAKKNTTRTYHLTIIDFGKGIYARPFMKITLNGETYTVQGDVLFQKRVSSRPLSDFTVTHSAQQSGNYVACSVTKSSFDITDYQVIEMGILYSRAGKISDMETAQSALVYATVGDGTKRAFKVAITNNLENYVTYTNKLQYSPNNYDVYTRGYAVLQNTVDNTITYVYSDVLKTTYTNS